MLCIADSLAWLKDLQPIGCSSLPIVAQGCQWLAKAAAQWAQGTAAAVRRSRGIVGYGARPHRRTFGSGGVRVHKNALLRGGDWDASGNDQFVAIIWYGVIKFWPLGKNGGT
jgi:hypothetical protein